MSSPEELERVDSVRVRDAASSASRLTFASWLSRPLTAGCVLPALQVRLRRLRDSRVLSSARRAATGWLSPARNSAPGYVSAPCGIRKRELRKKMCLYEYSYCLTYLINLVYPYCTSTLYCNLYEFRRRLPHYLLHDVTRLLKGLVIYCTVYRLLRMSYKQKVLGIG